MKAIATIILMSGLLLGSTGCYTPAYSPSERHAQIARNWDYEMKQATDDFDSIMLLRPASTLTIWHVQ